MLATFEQVSNRDYLSQAKERWNPPRPEPVKYERKEKPIREHAEVRRLSNGRYASKIGEEIQRSQDRTTIAVIEVKEIYIKNKRGLRTEIATWFCDWCESECAGDQFKFGGGCFCSKKCIKLHQINK